MSKYSKMAYNVFLPVVFLILTGIGAGQILAGAVKPVSDKQIILFLHLEDDEVSLTKIKVRHVPYRTPRGGYAGTWKIEVRSLKSKLLYKKRFMDPTILFWDKVDPETGKIIDGGMKHLDKVDFIIVLPYNEQARRLKVYRQKVLSTPTPKSIDQLINTIQLPPKEQWEVIPKP